MVASLPVHQVLALEVQVQLALICIHSIFEVQVQVHSLCMCYLVVNSEDTDHNILLNDKVQLMPPLTIIEN